MADDNDIIGPIHPGEYVAEVIEDLGMTQYAFAKALGVAQMRVKRLVDGTTGITANTALRLSRVLDTTPEYWMGLQSAYDIEVESAKCATQMADIRPLAV